MIALKLAQYSLPPCPLVRGGQTSPHRPHMSSTILLPLQPVTAIYSLAEVCCSSFQHGKRRPVGRAPPVLSPFPSNKQPRQL